MCANDLIVQGAEPLFFLDYFATGKLDPNVAQAVIASIAEGLQASRLRADRRRDRGNAGHVCRGRLRSRRLLRRRGRARRGADRGAGQGGRHHSRPRIVRRAFERILARAPARRRQGMEARSPVFVRSGPAADRFPARADPDLRQIAAAGRSRRQSRARSPTSPAAACSRISPGSCPMACTHSSMPMPGRSRG